MNIIISALTVRAKTILYVLSGILSTKLGAKVKTNARNGNKKKRRSASGTRRRNDVKRPNTNTEDTIPHQRTMNKNMCFMTFIAFLIHFFIEVYLGAMRAFSETDSTKEKLANSILPITSCSSVAVLVFTSILYKPMDE